jgi:hypothetical protein
MSMILIAEPSMSVPILIAILYLAFLGPIPKLNTTPPQA